MKVQTWRRDRSLYPKRLWDVCLFSHPRGRSLPSSRILPTRRIFGTELTEMKPQLLPRGLFHSTSVPKSRNRSTRLYERFGGPAYFTRLRSKPAAVTDAAPGARWTRPAASLGAEEVLPSDPCVPRCGVLPAPAPAACKPHTARRVDGAARPRCVCDPRSRHEAFLASAEGLRKLQRRHVSQTVCPGPGGPDRPASPHRGGACTPAYACVFGALATPAWLWQR